MALTYDDGPGPYTAKLLDELTAAKVPATLFMLGQNAQAHPDLVRRAAETGQVVANHTWDHRDLARLDTATARWEIDTTAALLRRLSGQPVNLRVEPEAKLPVGPFLVLQRFDPLRPVRRLRGVLDRHPMLQRARVDLHAAYAARARRIASERDTCSRSAIASNANSSSAVSRTATTCIGSAPRPGRPRPRRLSWSTS